MTDCTLLIPKAFRDFCFNFPDFFYNIIEGKPHYMNIQAINLSLNGATNEDLYVFHLTEDYGSLCDRNNREAGPILLIPDCFEDASAWFEGEGRESFPAKLC